MPRNSVGLAFAYFQHWLRKEDLYSQQSPFIFFALPGLNCLFKSPEFSHLKTTDFSASIFSSARGKRSTGTEKLGSTEHQNPGNNWKPRKKAALICSYFCQTTAAKQVIELGTGTGVVTRLLDQVTKGHLYTFSEGGLLMQRTSFLHTPR